MSLPIIFSLLALPVVGSGSDDITVKVAGGRIMLLRGEVPVLTYHCAELDPPEGVDRIYRRSGLVHPLCAPSGVSVTGIHPEDHRHHYGLWHAWVQTKHGEDSPDFWNVGGRTGTVRYSGTQEIRSAGFSVRQEHVSFPAGATGQGRVVLSEVLSIDAAFQEGVNVIDYDLCQTNITDLTLELPAYRYGGGLAFRSPPNWNATNSNYLTREGRDRKNSHTTRAEWVAMYGPAGAGETPVTVVILCHPSNHDAPQHIRTWDDGRVFFNYVPIQETAWQIRPRESIRLRYRILVFDGGPDRGRIEGHWDEYRNS